jgi:hypothetical protein
MSPAPRKSACPPSWYEGHARPGGRLLEDHGQGPALERVRELRGAGLEPGREVEDLVDLLPRVVLQGDEVLLLHPPRMITDAASHFVVE